MRCLPLMLLLSLIVTPTRAAADATPEALRARIDAIAKRLPEFHRQIEQRRASVQDVAYPLVTYTVLDNFTRYFKDDLETSVPLGWGLTAVNGAAATYEPVRESHSGRWAARIANRTPLTPNVYGLLENSDVRTLKAGQAYTLSVWAKCEGDPGGASLPVNAGWSD